MNVDENFVGLGNVGFDLRRYAVHPGRIRKKQPSRMIIMNGIMVRLS